MFRLPVLACVSRETNRLPANTINSSLGCKSAGLPFDQIAHLASASPSKFVLYRISAHELPREPEAMTCSDRFVLVEVNGSHEKILDQGDVEGSTGIHMGEVRYADLSVIGKKLGRFKFYVSLTPELEKY